MSGVKELGSYGAVGQSFEDLRARAQGFGMWVSGSPSWAPLMVGTLPGII